MECHEPIPPIEIEITRGDNRNVVSLINATVDCNSLFEEVSGLGDGTGLKYKLRHSEEHRLLDLAPLDALRLPNGPDPFLPQRIYVRGTMQEMFNLIVQHDDPRQYCVVFGSPGVGKSVLAFLAALCYVRYNRAKKYGALFIRKTENRTAENISAFWIRQVLDKNQEPTGFVNVMFDREIGRHNDLHHVHAAICWDLIFANDSDTRTKYANFHHHIRSINDGPRHGERDHVSASDIVTSGGYKPPRDEAAGTIKEFPLSAWTAEDVMEACKSLFGPSSAKAKEYFDVCGGNIRKITRIFTGQTSIEEVRSEIDDVIRKERIYKKLELAYCSTELSSDDSSIDRLRAMFATPKKGIQGAYDTVQFIGSQYILRAIRSRLSLKTAVEGLEYAKKTEIASLYGWHFEIFAHKVYDELSQIEENTAAPENPQSTPNCIRFSMLQGEGTGKESVKQLTKQGVYWMPSISNFANIDAAIAINRVLYCIQYTVSIGYNFNYNTFLSEFWNNLVGSFRSKIEEICVVFVVPDGITFQKVILLPKNPSDRVCFVHSAQDGILVVNANDADAIDLDTSFSDMDQEETNPKIEAETPAIRFQWEALPCTPKIAEKHPLSFMRLRAQAY